MTPEEIALVAEDLGADIVVHAVPVQGEGERVFASLRPFEQRTLVAFHAQLLRYVAQEELETLELFDATSPPPVVVRRGRLVQLQESDRRAGRAMLEVRARLRAEALAREPPPPPVVFGPLQPFSAAKPPPRQPPRSMRETRAWVVAESMAWHAFQNGGVSRSPDLANHSPTTSGVQALGTHRASLLRLQGAYPEAPPERTGRQLEISVSRRMFLPDAPYFDAFGLPPPDYWCWCAEGTLVVWVPQQHIGKAEARIARAPADHRWRLWP